MKRPPKDTKIVTIGGGTGSFTVLSGLKKRKSVDLTAIIAMSDDGGSTGRLRTQLGILPPGDVRQALVAMAKSDRLLLDLFNYRFMDGSLSGHSFGNLLLAALEKITGDGNKAIEKAGEILAICGDVIPVTTDRVYLFGDLVGGGTIAGEHNIQNYAYGQGGDRLKKVYLNYQAKANPKAIKAIAEADMVVIGPGSVYTSIIPNFLVAGITNALKRTKAKRILVANLMAEPGLTENYQVTDFLSKIEEYLGQNIIETVIYNTQRPSARSLSKYVLERKSLVLPDKQNFLDRSCHFIGARLLDNKSYKQKPGDQLSRSLIRHNSDALAKVICRLA